MTANFGTVLNRENWEVSIISEDMFSATSRTSPAERGFVIWDKITDQRVSLPTIGALEILTDMRDIESWKKNGRVMGMFLVICDSEYFLDALHKTRGRKQDKVDFHKIRYLIHVRYNRTSVLRVFFSCAILERIWRNHD